MEFITVRDLRIRPGEVWRELRRRQELVLTSNGRPIAVLLDVADGDVEATLAALRRARAQLAVSRLREQAAEQGLDRLSVEDIQAEVIAARGERARGERGIN